MDKELNYQVYWEKQGADSLCGVHCINSLLQGPFFDQIKLSQIGLKLDQQQKQLMGQATSHQSGKFLKQESHNVGLSGLYSIQVLQQALKLYKLELISITAINESSNLNEKNAFICNSSEHWIAIRKINNIWYNLNSIGMRLPQIISDFYLSAFLSAVKQSGYSIFSVQGMLPKPNQEDFDYLNDHQAWYPAKRIFKYQQRKSKRKGYQPNIGGGNSNQMQKAIALSLGKQYAQYISSGEDSDWQNDKPPQLKPFQGKGMVMHDQNLNIAYDKFQYDPYDTELIQIMKMTLQEQFKTEPNKGFNISIRHPSGKKQRRIFDRNSTVQAIYDYIWMGRNPQNKFYLVDMFSKQKLTQLYIPIESLIDPSDQELSLNLVDL